MLFYDKEYHVSDYLSYQDLNTLIDKEKELVRVMNLNIEEIDLDLPIYEINDFVYIEDIDKIERNIMYMAYAFYQPSGYIENKIWKDKDEAVYKSFSYEDLNRIITDMNLLYEHRNDEVLLYGMVALNTTWNYGSEIEWE